ncbi:IRK-interacting protein-like [Phalaenopsis equestris]|uniref:IRK-interacting protein-like n=1 Tax=Phalaenopsis equestris TaxID=78828 RepID=UPI0009E33AC3|nr:IRK-interacting protein-like [Phalaenopsis equestris]
MDYSISAPAPPIGLAVLSKTFTKLLRFRHDNFNSSTTAPITAKEESLYNNKHSSDISQHGQKEIESVAAKIFAGVSAVKAAYAQLQLAQTPYDPDAIQSADQAIVTELKRLSVLKQSFLNRAEHSRTSKGAQPELSSQVQEQRNLLKTYKITTTKLESELRSKDSEVLYLQSELRAAEKRCRVLEARLRPGRTLAALDELHLTGLNPTHFLTLLRSAVKSIRSFVKIMTLEMESAGWNLDAAASAIQPDLLGHCNLKNRVFAFESYVSRLMFSDFQNPDFSLGGPVRDRQGFFAEFSELKFLKPKQCIDTKIQFEKFCRVKYLRLVHPKMEASFFGDQEQQVALSSSQGILETDFFEGFSEMARRVWLLHCLFFSFGTGEKAAIFEVKKGSRFSEVYMESVAEVELGADRRPAVGFTVVPGFKVGKTVIQCRVYLIASSSIQKD